MILDNTYISLFISFNTLSANLLSYCCKRFYVILYDDHASIWDIIASNT